jgi:protein arginine kinase
MRSFGYAQDDEEVCPQLLILNSPLSTLNFPLYKGFMQKKQQDIVISSRVRLARNVAGLRFPAGLAPSQGLELIKDVYAAVADKGVYTLYPAAKLSGIDGTVMKEKHLVSQDLLQNRETGAVILSEAETISIMVGEEDHIRIQCILSGCNFTEAYKIASLVDDDIAKAIRYAFDPALGYLTACPTNLGTGMRASAMMFLPGLSITNSLEACMRAIARMNMTIRGVYGEGSESAGCLYQVSNQRTLGASEQEILTAVEMSVGHIEDAETRARAVLKNTHGGELRDKIMRAYGTLLHAYKLGSAEFMQLVALVKLGVYYEYIKIKDAERFEKLITSAQPASLQSLSDTALNAEERDVFRASYVSKTLRQLT